MRLLLALLFAYAVVCTNYAVILSDFRHDYCACTVYGYLDRRPALTETGQPLLFLTRADADRYAQAYAKP